MEEKTAPGVSLRIPRAASRAYGARLRCLRPAAAENAASPTAARRDSSATTVWPPPVAAAAASQSASPDDDRAKKARTPVNPLVGPLLTDFYQISMAYTYWKHGRHERPAVFERAPARETRRARRARAPPGRRGLYFRKNPFGGEFTIFGGLEECLCYVENFKVTDDDVEYLRTLLPRAEDEFFEWIRSVDCSKVQIYAVREGTVVFPKRAAASRGAAAGCARPEPTLVAQGPDGGVSRAATRARAFSSFESAPRDDRSSLHAGEFAAFAPYALANPTNFVALVDTYSTLETGLKNFVTVALALKECGFAPKGVRIDSGDLAYLSRESLFAGVVDAFRGTRHEATAACLEAVSIVASNDINETVLLSLKEQGHAIDCYGIGTHLVTCQAQPALGCVYKLVEIDGEPCIKLSNEIAKTTIPGEVGERILCRHPFDHQKRARAARRRPVTPALFTFFRIWQRNEPVRELS
ncbi:nicotinate phosphoribosyltransferase [Aureococcus anophagefferens]|uniref:nicotinate phosphoribosyltransferase n=1 Tax=Aureococcus anophagefferens TaxID=44056 RepID=A0ABR1FU27_AURAN